MKTQKTTMTLPVQLTDQELKTYSKKLGLTLSERDRVEASLKEFSTQAKAKVQQHENTILMLTEKINTEKEWREVDCVVDFDYQNGTKMTTRLDTGEIVHTEIMLESERQQEMFAGEPK